uniref:DNA polymerase n=1 Tax=Panagrellus redivivus TaxID=6233 RepID=A0A7E4W7G4_PANRE
MESPTKITSSQKAASDLFTESMRASSVHGLTVLSIEVLFACCGGGATADHFLPDPAKDPILGIFFAIYPDVCISFQRPKHHGGFIRSDIRFDATEFPNVSHFDSEVDLLDALANLIRTHDPDIIVGYDINRTSLAYCLKRANTLQCSSLGEAVSRLRVDGTPIVELADVRGRILLNVWDIVRSDHPMRHYRLSAVVSSILRRRFADVSQKWIETVLSQDDASLNSMILRHFHRKADISVQILVALDIFIKTSQMARVYGIQFTEVLNRGSQFRVEAMMLRLTAAHNFIAPSVSVEQRNAMTSPETIPLNMEPRSGLYYDPVVVLDFQSLYPSVCIAYNYCFSTCIGRLNEIRQCLDNKNDEYLLGALPFDAPNVDLVADLHKHDQIHISPVGGVFVKKETRKSLIAMMLEELLETRVMVKQSMKRYDDPVLNRLLNARQLALKLIANVTYGYTSANWSGRMPCAEVADAIVSKGREALEKAIQMIVDDAKSVLPKYRGAEVIYGDTDSLFILMPGLTRAEAFVLGRQIADDVTAMNPYPMKLKFEKVMMPCCLISKKRYVGMSYENETDMEGVFDAKGIETVRRDSCEFVAHTMETVLRLLFDDNVDGAVQYLRYKMQNVEKIRLADFIISGDYRVNYAESAVLPMKKIASELEAISPLHKPVYGERLEFIVAEPPVASKNCTVYSCVFRLQKFLENPQLTVNYNYYIGRKLMPALARVFQLIPLKVNWHLGNQKQCFGCGTGADLWCSSCWSDKTALKRVIKAISDRNSAFVSSKLACMNCVKLRPSMRADIPCSNLQCVVWQHRYRVQSSNVHELLKFHKYGSTLTAIKLPNIVR